MKQLIFFTFTFISLSVQAQKTLTIEQVDKQWQTQNIKVGTRGKASVLQLTEAFQKTWPTYSGKGVLDFAKTNRTEDDYGGIVIDKKNGFVQYAEDWPDAENDEHFMACYWNRANGHGLYAVSLHRFMLKEFDVLCFYDYDPNTGVLKPERSMANFFKPSFPGYRYRVFLPRNGKNLEVQEFFGWLTIKHTYQWDGMRPTAPATELDHIDMLQTVYHEHYFSTDELTQYALIDIDNDGKPELWMQSDDGESQAVYGVALTCDLLGGQGGGRTLSFYRGAVCDGGPCGALCLSSVYRYVVDSSYKTTLMDMQEWDNEIDSYGPSTYTYNGETLMEGEGERLILELGDPLTFKPEWRRIVRL